MFTIFCNWPVYNNAKTFLLAFLHVDRSEWMGRLAGAFLSATIDLAQYAIK